MRNVVFLDTNILLYSLAFDGLDEEKGDVARRLIGERNFVLSVQVLQEFFHQSTRSTRRRPLSSSDALILISAWSRADVQETTRALLDIAFAHQIAHRYSIWDCLIIAAAQAQGCTTLYTEDMQHGRIINSLRIVNPFRN